MALQQSTPSQNASKARASPMLQLPPNILVRVRLERRTHSSSADQNEEAWPYSQQGRYTARMYTLPAVLSSERRRLEDQDPDLEGLGASGWYQRWPWRRVACKPYRCPAATDSPKPNPNPTTNPDPILRTRTTENNASTHPHTLASIPDLFSSRPRPASSESTTQSKYRLITNGRPSPPLDAHINPLIRTSKKESMSRRRTVDTTGGQPHSRAEARREAGSGTRDGGKRERDGGERREKGKRGVGGEKMRNVERIQTQARALSSLAACAARSVFIVAVRRCLVHRSRRVAAVDVNARGRRRERSDRGSEQRVVGGAGLRGDWRGGVSQSREDSSRVGEGKEPRRQERRPTPPQNTFTPSAEQPEDPGRHRCPHVFRQSHPQLHPNPNPDTYPDAYSIIPISHNEKQEQSGHTPPRPSPSSSRRTNTSTSEPRCQLYSYTIFPFATDACKKKRPFDGQAQADSHFETPFPARRQLLPAGVECDAPQRLFPSSRPSTYVRGESPGHRMTTRGTECIRAESLNPLSSSAFPHSLIERGTKDDDPCHFPPPPQHESSTGDTSPRPREYASQSSQMKIQDKHRGTGRYRRTLTPSMPASRIASPNPNPNPDTQRDAYTVVPTSSDDGKHNSKPAHFIHAPYSFSPSTETTPCSSPTTGHGAARNTPDERHGKQETRTFVPANPIPLLRHVSWLAVEASCAEKGVGER
ncbi:hypothetical protein R3P38DRAFT_2810047 [Favolaschia claudopus]|uniref:Uncharacterized protein n=1 Tax=Favolaschia claudopus TaxID=2862362 RepID=A0AAV9ZBF0_9AGAR